MFRQYLINCKVFLVMALLLLVPVKGDSKESEGSINVNALKFERWVREKRDEFEAKNKPPIFCGEVILRLRKGLSVTDQTVMTCLGAWNFFESVALQSSETGQDIKDYKETLRFIYEIETLINSQQLLKAELLIRKASIYNNMGASGKAIDFYQKSSDVLGGLHITVDKRLMDNLVALGDLLYSIGNINEAEERYLKVLSYPWYLVEDDPESLDTLRNFYIRAGYGIINCRRGDPMALENTFFVPATLEELGPVLEKAKSDTVNQ